MQSEKRYPFMFFGIPVLVVRISLNDGRLFAVAAPGRAIKRLRKVAEVLKGTVVSMEGD